MATYSISYDLNGRGKNYDELFERIKSYGTYVKPLKSQWFVVTSDSAYDIASHLESALDDDDQLIVAALTRRDASWIENFDDDIQDWLKRYF